MMENQKKTIRIRGKHSWEKKAKKYEGNPRTGGHLKESAERFGKKKNQIIDLNFGGERQKARIKTKYLRDLWERGNMLYQESF